MGFWRLNPEFQHDLVRAEPLLVGIVATYQDGLQNEVKVVVLFAVWGLFHWGSVSALRLLIEESCWVVDRGKWNAYESFFFSEMAAEMTLHHQACFLRGLTIVGKRQSDGQINFPTVQHHRWNVWEWSVCNYLRHRSRCLDFQKGLEFQE